MYLPQFHEIPENNEWWGEGYTEWTAVRNAKALFEGHNQPRKPINGDYYDLLKKETMIRQAELAKEYELDGFCFYHYYFKEGRKILEKPAEKLLEWKDIIMPFCFCWANESWARTWSNIPSKNVWADSFENSFRGKNGNGVLLEQKYEREEAWKQHFDYLLPFFQDKRYIKFLDMPVFLIYKPAEVLCLAEMSAYWQVLAKERGLKGIYIIGMNTMEGQQGVDAILINGPTMYWSNKIRSGKVESDYVNGIRNYSYEEIWKNAVKSERVSGYKTYFGAFTDYDDTPRRGIKGTFLKNGSLDLYEKYLYEIMKKNRQAGNEFQFINAFNEWGEGMYMEPDERNGYSYLKITQNVKKRIEEEDVELMEYAGNEMLEANIIEKSKTEKYKIYMDLLDKWMVLREKNIHVKQYLDKYGYKQIVIYGYGMLGKHLLTELLADGVEIVCVIDRKINVIYEEIEACNIEDNLKNIDAIIVTPVCEFDGIWREIKKQNVEVSVMSLQEIIEDM